LLGLSDLWRTKRREGEREMTRVEEARR